MDTGCSTYMRPLLVVLANKQACRSHRPSWITACGGGGWPGSTDGANWLLQGGWSRGGALAVEQGLCARWSLSGGACTAELVWNLRRDGCHGSRTPGKGPGGATGGGEEDRQVG
jgi:hypothetical protein